MSTTASKRDFVEADYVRRMEETAAVATGSERVYRLMCAGAGAHLTRMRLEANETGGAALTDYSKALQTFTGAMYASFLLDHIDPEDRVAYIENVFTEIANNVIRHVEFCSPPEGTTHVQ